MEDSGQRREFSTGAVRDRGDAKPRPDFISPFFQERLGWWLQKGAEKYQPRNWEKGIPISECVASLERHLMKYKMGLRDEDHAAAIAANIMFIIHFEEGITRGFLPDSLYDMPRYTQQTVLQVTGKDKVCCMYCGKDISEEINFYMHSSNPIKFFCGVGCFNDFKGEQS